jgi:hypothetical protein
MVVRAFDSSGSSSSKHTHMYGEIKVSDVRNWVLNNKFNNGNPSKHDIWFADMLEKKYSTGSRISPLHGAWLTTWAVERLFTTFLMPEWAFKAMSCDVPTYFKDNPAVEPSCF